MKILRPIS